jgi:hypothetical protein
MIYEHKLFRTEPGANEATHGRALGVEDAAAVEAVAQLQQRLLQRPQVWQHERIEMHVGKHVEALHHNRLCPQMSPYCVETTHGSSCRRTSMAGLSTVVSSTRSNDMYRSDTAGQVIITSCSSPSAR